MDVEPTGLVRVVPPRDLVFSTSDARGVIDGANAVFCRIAALSEGDLRGSPHNVIRHPDIDTFVVSLRRILELDALATQYIHRCKDVARTKRNVLNPLTLIFAQIFLDL